MEEPKSEEQIRREERLEIFQRMMDFVESTVSTRIAVKEPPEQEGYDLGPAKWPEPWMLEAFEKFRVCALTTCRIKDCGGDLWLFGAPRVGTCSKCATTYVEDGLLLKRVVFAPRKGE